VQATSGNVCNVVEPVAASVTTIDVTLPAVMLGTVMFCNVVVEPAFVRRIVLV
jgi:hypothetical protein